jgi:hypothetical protein
VTDKTLQSGTTAIGGRHNVLLQVASVAALCERRRSLSL